jgi:hypothetical protein
MVIKCGCPVVVRSLSARVGKNEEEMEAMNELGR